MSKIDELTLREIREIRALFPADAPLPSRSVSGSRLGSWPWSWSWRLSA